MKRLNKYKLMISIGLAAIVSPHVTVTAGYGHLGTVLNTRENTAWAAAVKYEF